MNDFVLYDGQFYSSNTPLVGAANRGLRYGDGLFETILYCDGGLHFMDWHFERLFSGLALLAFEIPPHFTPGSLGEQAKGLCKKNGHANARVRINLFRGNGGLYDAENHTPHCIIESWQLPHAGFELNENGLVTGIYPHARKAMDQFSNCKHNNYLPYTMAALHAKKQQWNDAFLLNAAGRVCDATIANVFIIKDGAVYTPPLEEGCVAGIMRRFILENLPAHGLGATEKSITPGELMAADEIFVSNAIRGMSWVSRCGDSVYTNLLTRTIFANLLKK